MALSKRWYATLEGIRLALGSSTADAAYLKSLIDRASIWLEQATGRTFVPVTRSSLYDCPGDLAGDLVLYDDLLAVVSLTDADGAWAGSEYLLYPLNSGRKSRIRPVGRSWAYDSTPYGAITLNGRWGYTEQTEATGATLAAAITTTTATTFTVNDGSLIETGWALLVDSEQFFVSAVSGATVTVTRGNNGTTAATHSNAAPVSRYVPHADAQQAVSLLVQTWVNWAETVGVASKSISTGGYSVSFGGQWDVPQNVKDIAATLRRPLVTAVY